jgi:nucleoside-diphosphate-sugar epimerase
MNILLTGSNGFLGKYIYKEISKGNIVYTLNRKNSNYNIDLSKSIPNFENNFDLVIHTAGLAHVLNIKNEKQNQFYLSNVLGTLNLLNGLTHKHIPKKFVFISSVSVYGLLEGEFVNEEFPLIASDAYGQSKIDAENEIIKWGKNNNVLITILRLPLIVGENPPGNLGAMINGIRKGYYFNIGNGSARKSMVLASDVSRYILCASDIGGIYNLTDGYHPSFYELSYSISRKYKKIFFLRIPLFIAKILSIIGDLFNDSFPLNTLRFKKITSTLTFDDARARKSFNWNPNSAIYFFEIKKYK